MATLSGPVLETVPGVGVPVGFAGGVAGGVEPDPQPPIVKRKGMRDGSHRQRMVEDRCRPRADARKEGDPRLLVGGSGRSVAWYPYSLDNSLLEVRCPLPP